MKERVNISVDFNNDDRIVGVSLSSSTNTITAHFSKEEALKLEQFKDSLEIAIHMLRRGNETP